MKPSVTPMIMFSIKDLTVRRQAMCLRPPCQTINLTLVPLADLTSRRSMSKCLMFCAVRQSSVSVYDPEHALSLWVAMACLGEGAARTSHGDDPRLDVAGHALGDGQLFVLVNVPHGCRLERKAALSLSLSKRVQSARKCRQRVYLKGWSGWAEFALKICHSHRSCSGCPWMLWDFRSFSTSSWPELSCNCF